jgi:2-phosphoglycerate kinase
MALDSDALGWRALLIGGQSGAGKSTVAEALGRRLGIPWLQVDDLRLALERSRVTLPAGTEKLYFFEKTPDLWRLPPERLRDALIGIGEVMSPAIEVVVANHVAQRNPAVIEGDGILPSLMERPEVRPLAVAGLARAVFVVEPDEDVLLGNMRARGRGFNARTEAEVLVEVRAKGLYGRWLAAEARSRGLPVLAPRPWATLGERILAAAAAPS